MSLSPFRGAVSTAMPGFWPVAVIIIVIVLKAPTELLPAVLSAAGGTVTVLLGAGSAARPDGSRSRAGR